VCNAHICPTVPPCPPAQICEDTIQHNLQRLSVFLGQESPLELNVSGARGRDLAHVRA